MNTNQSEMNHQSEEQVEAVRPRTPAQGCIFLLALVIVGIIEFVDAVPYHLRFYAWCAWHYTGGQIRLGIMSWRLHLSQRRIRKNHPSDSKQGRRANFR
jgi:hypothetical protein